MSRFGMVFAVMVLVAFACGPQTPTLPQAPQIKTDVDSIGFGQEFGSATYDGTTATAELRIDNKGQQDLVISSVSFTNASNHHGANVFTLTGPAQTTIPSTDFTFIQLTFSPIDSGLYAGSLTIHSNAQNIPSKTVGLSGKGVNPDGGV